MATGSLAKAILQPGETVELQAVLDSARLGKQRTSGLFLTFMIGDTVIREVVFRYTAEAMPKE